MRSRAGSRSIPPRGSTPRMPSINPRAPFPGCVPRTSRRRMPTSPGTPGSWPEIAFGLPLLANGQSAPFSPYKLLALWPTEGAWTAGFLLGRLALAGVGMLALAAYLGFSPWAGALGALAFMLNANFLNHLSFNDLHAYMALPWLLLLGERLRRAPDRRGVAMFGLGIGVTGLLGHPEAALYAAAAACLVLALGARADGWSGRRLAVVLGLAAGLGGLLTAVILLPFAEFLLQSTSYLFGERHAFLSTHTLPDPKNTH